MRRGSRIWLVVGVIIGMVEASVPQRAFAQRRATVMPGLRFGPPLRAGFALGVAYGNRVAIGHFGGVIALGEVAAGGGRVSAGYFLSGPFASGLELLGSAIHTWGSPTQLEPGQTLVGGEVRASFFFVNVGGGAFRPTRGFDDDRRTRYYLNVGLGI